MNRKKSMLSSPEWKTIPWCEKPKNSRDLLLDILIDMPGLLEDLDALNECPSSQERQRLRQELIGKCWMYDALLLDWANSICPSQQPFGSSYQPPEDEIVSPQQLAHAHGLSLYWTTCLLLYSTLASASGSSSILLPERTDPRVYIGSIAKVVPVLLRAGSGMYGQHIAALPLGVALQFAMATDSMAHEQAMLVRNFEIPRGRVVNGFLLSVNCDERRHKSQLTKIDGPESISIRAKTWAGIR